MQWLGAPLDPMLAGLYARTGRATLGDFVLYRPGSGTDGVLDVNAGLRGQGQTPFPSCVLFGQVSNLEYYYGVVPDLADAHGVQPVLYVDVQEEPHVVPVASNVEALLHQLACFMDLLPEQSDFVPGRCSTVMFPFAAAELIAEDRALVDMMRAGRFDGLVTRDEESQRWMQQVLAASPGR
ncbi:hypothetical protein D7Y13_27180 [Corallococcus praedator]|uniref:SMI1/KNR4 family protein n=2 Tax=Myxococcaceae TaxID=31 RepID=A0ABX9QBE0_9BACT|nr:hypothetical protein D7X74_03930 [Corallococcus sp. CA047B]RKH34798.1 hypothetical protein D7X75_06970 [Corallococcus sp. CA031C]RKH99893.1 hypothetical protein D7Y13_27180 [Corallococcus praedator]